MEGCRGGLTSASGRFDMEDCRGSSTVAITVSHRLTVTVVWRKEGTTGKAIAEEVGREVDVEV